MTQNLNTRLKRLEDGQKSTEPYTVLVFLAGDTAPHFGIRIWPDGRKEALTVDELAEREQAEPARLPPERKADAKRAQKPL